MSTRYELREHTAVTHRKGREKGHHSTICVSSLTKHVWNLHLAVSPGNSLLSQNTMSQGYTPLHCTIFSFSLAPQALMKPIKFVHVPYLLYRDYIKRNDVGFLLMPEGWQTIMEVNCCSAC